MLCYWKALAFLWLDAVVLLTEMAPEGTIPRSKKKDKEMKWNGFLAFFEENVCGACLGKTCRRTRVFWVVADWSKTVYSVCQDSENVSLH